MRYLFMDDQTNLQNQDLLPENPLTPDSTDNDQENFSPPSDTETEMTPPLSSVDNETKTETSPFPSESDSNIGIETNTPLPSLENETNDSLPPIEVDNETEFSKDSSVSENKDRLVSNQEYQNLLDQYAESQKPAETDLLLQNELPSEFIQPTKNPSTINFFKYFFLFSLIVFIITIFSFISLYLIKANENKKSNLESSIKSAPSLTKESCLLNDKKYDIGETFTASDGCNTCTCKVNNTIDCTDNECAPSSSNLKSSTSPTSTASAVKK